MKSFISVLSALVIVISIVSCTPPPPPLQESDFTKFTFTEYASREVREKSFQPAVFIIESDAPLYSIRKTKATLMFKDIEKDEYLPVSFPLRVEGCNPFKPEFCLLRTEKEIIVDDYRKKGILFLIKFERTLPTSTFSGDLHKTDCIETMTFFSNVRQAYFEEPVVTTNSGSQQTVLPPPPKGPLTVVEKESKPLDNLLGPGKYKYYQVQVLYAEQGILVFESGRFAQANEGKISIDSVAVFVDELISRYKLAETQDMKIIVTGTASVLQLKPEKKDEPNFENQKIYFDDQTILKEEPPYTRIDMNYNNDELPKLRALKTKEALVRRLTAKLPNIENQVYAAYQKPRGDDKDGYNRRLDIVLAIPIK
jgi:hypothetical protein